MSELSPLEQVARDAAQRASENSSFDKSKRTPPQLLFAPILFALQDAVKAGLLSEPQP